MIDYVAEAIISDKIIDVIENNNIKKLLKIIGSNINRQDFFGCTPLMIAVARGKSKVVRGLLEAGANIYIQSNCGSTALHYAKKEHKEIVILLYKALSEPYLITSYGAS